MGVMARDGRIGVSPFPSMSALCTVETLERQRYEWYGFEILQAVSLAIMKFV